MPNEKVLLVEDELDIAAPYSRYLQRRGIIVDTAADLVTAKDLVQRKSYQVALVDIMLAGPDHTNRDGPKLVQYLQYLREDTIPVIISQQEDAQLAADMLQRHGAYRYISKATVRNQTMQVLYDTVMDAVKDHNPCPFGRYDDKTRGSFERKSALSFIGGGGDAPVLVDRFLRTLHPKGGFAPLNEFFEKFVTPLAPLIPLSDSEDYAAINEGAELIHGTFWSKAYGKAIVLVICRTNNLDKSLATNLDLRWDSGPEFLPFNERFIKEDLCGIVFDLNAPRTAFMERIPSD